ncbi:Crp/Fnr family transcriptional regulator [Terrisporobacter sp.]|uniref:Crp/Fnr family transcriptional regulator n=1 Tax=Terrisporobacter sp. TaxID=1965305 RepID=UPI00260D15CD|nr:Crp/Fnr family transcriptional regulator [Terrisporobacter sp.]
MDIEYYLKDILPFFNDLNDEEKMKLISKCNINKYKKGEIVHSKNSSCTGLLITLSGNFRGFISSPNGREITLFKLYERDVCMLSASCAFKNLTYDVNLEAETECSAIVLDSSLLEKLTSNNLSVIKYMLYLAQDKLSQVMYVLEQTTFFSLDERISEFLINQSNIENSNILYMTHENIANELGSSREVVSRILKKFEKEKKIEIYRGKIKLINLK